MADKLGVSLPTYSRIERNINTMPFKRIVKLAKVFGITTSELVSIGSNKNDLLNENVELKKIIIEKEKDIISLQKRIIELLDKK
jgi:transcriptional regulator with XRE-family HTH domain